MSRVKGQKRLTDKQIAHALKGTSGNVAAAARALDVDRSTLWRRISESDDLKRTLEDAREELVDNAESALRREVLAGNIAAIIFTLKTQGKRRGYVERQEHEVSGKDGGAIDTRVVVEYVNRAPTLPTRVTDDTPEGDDGDG